MNAEPDNYLKIIDGLNEEILRLREREVDWAASVDQEQSHLRHCRDLLDAAEARVRELEGQLLRAREAPGGPQDQRVRELEEERDSANRSSFAANEILHERTNQLEAAEARLAIQDEASRQHEYAAARLERCVARLEEALREIDRETQDSEVALIARRALAHEEEA